MRLFCALIPVLVIACTGLLAQSEAGRPRLAQRLVKLYDFEERGQNPLPVPSGWIRAQHAKDSGRADFPISWNLPELDYTIAFRGEGSVRLHARGDNSGLQLRDHVVPVFPGADYAITARVRTQNLRVARAFMGARFLDAHGSSIVASEVRSAPVVSEGGWSTISLSLRGDYDNAAFLQIDLELMQPEHFASPGLAGDAVVWDQDRSARAWFDDIAILQAPRIEVATNSPDNVIIAHELPSLKAHVRDLTGQSLTANLEVRDDRGRLIDSRSATVPRGDARIELEPALPGYGWYRATLTLQGESVPAGRAQLDFVWVPEDPAIGDLIEFGTVARDKPRFGAIAPWVPHAHRARIAELTRVLRVGWLTVPVWNLTLSSEEAKALVEDLIPEVDALLRAGVEVSFALERTPSKAAGDVVGQAGGVTLDPAAAIAIEEGVYQPLLLPILDRFGQIVSRWQFGRIGDDTRHYTAPGAASREALRAAKARLGGLVPDPKVEISWSALHRLRAPEQSESTARRGKGEPAIDGYRTVIPSSTAPAHVAEHVRIVLDQAREAVPESRLTLVFETLPADRFAPRDIAVDLVKRIVLAWGVAGDHRSAPFIAINEPWRSEGEPRPSIMPGPHLPALRHLLQRIADRRIVGELNLDPELRLLILSPSASAPAERGGALIAWSDGALGDPKEILLGTGGADIRLFDLYGNELAQPVRVADASDVGAAGARAIGARSVEGGAQQARVTITTEPVFIEGVDVELLRFLSSMRLDPPFLASTVVQHDGAIEIFNPWEVPVVGRLAITEPGGFVPGVGRDDSWRFQPRAFSFDVAPGETQRFPIGIEFSISQEAGWERMVVDLAFEARRMYRLTHEIPFEVGVKELRVELDQRWVDGGKTLIVGATLQNLGETDKTLEIAAFAPGVGRRSASVGRLPPGERVERQFTYENARSLVGKSVSITVTDAETRDRVNKAVEVR